MKGKNKLVPRLLGITKESVMRVDEKTKEVIQEWSLTNIKRWAASPKSFTLVGPSTGAPCLLPTPARVEWLLLLQPLFWLLLHGCSMEPCPPLVPLPMLALEAGAWVLSAYHRGSG